MFLSLMISGSNTSIRTNILYDLLKVCYLYCNVNATCLVARKPTCVQQLYNYDPFLSVFKGTFTLVIVLVVDNLYGCTWIFK